MIELLGYMASTSPQGALFALVFAYLAFGAIYWLGNTIVSFVKEFISRR